MIPSRCVIPNLSRTSPSSRALTRIFFHAHPTTTALVVEVAVTSPNDDRALAEIYAEAGVGEYWVVLPKERAIGVFLQPEGLAYREMHRYEFSDELACSTVPAVTFALPELFAGIAPAGA